MPELIEHKPSDATENATRKWPCCAEVQSFLIEHDLHNGYEKACEIARQEFPNGDNLNSRVQFVPDLDSEQLVVTLTANSDADAAVASHQQLLDRWTRELSFREQDLLSFTFTLR